MKFKASVSAGALAAATMLAAPVPAQAQADPLLGQMMAFGGNFCPRGWGEANGALLPISSNTALFSLLGTIYGGDGRTTFALPDLRARAPVGYGNGPGIGNYAQGQRGGSTSFTLTVNEMPSHTHTGTVRASPNAGDTNQPVRNTIALAPTGTNAFLDNDPPTNAMHPNTLDVFPAGGSQPVQKVSPFLAVRWCVALVGVYPSRN